MKDLESSSPTINEIPTIDERLVIMKDLEESMKKAIQFANRTNISINTKLWALAQVFSENGNLSDARKAHISRMLALNIGNNPLEFVDDSDDNAFWGLIIEQLEAYLTQLRHLDTTMPLPTEWESAQTDVTHLDSFNAKSKVTSQ